MLRVLWDLIFVVVFEIKEFFKWKQLVYSMVKDYFYLKVNKVYVNLGFFNFDKIENFVYLLEGIGKRMWYIKISDMVDFDVEKLKEII